MWYHHPNVSAHKAIPSTSLWEELPDLIDAAYNYPVKDTILLFKGKCIFSCSILKPDTDCYWCLISLLNPWPTIRETVLDCQWIKSESWRIWRYWWLWLPRFCDENRCCHPWWGQRKNLLFYWRCVLEVCFTSRRVTILGSQCEKKFSQWQDRSMGRTFMLHVGVVMVGHCPSKLQMRNMCQNWYINPILQYGILFTCNLVLEEIAASV